MTIASRLTGSGARLRRDRSGVALLEFALSLPVVLGIGLYAIEVSNLALMNMRISQAALNLADNASRVGLDSSSGSTQQLREVDIDDVLDGIKAYGAPWQLTTRGRVTLSSIETSAGVQRIHWQRCIGLKKGKDWDSSYGKTVKLDGTTYDPDAGVDTDTSNNDNSSLHPGTVTLGMGEPGSKVTAPNNSGVMFVEINYAYKPLLPGLMLPSVGGLDVQNDGTVRIQYIASFVVRDNRDFSQLYNPAPTATMMTCDKYTS